MAILARSPEYKTDMCRLRWAHSLYEPKSNNKDGSNAKYSAGLIFPNSVSKAPLEKLIIATVEEAWPKNGMAKLKSGQIKSPFHKGDGPQAHSQKTGELHPGMGPDVWFIRVQASLKFPCKMYWKSSNIFATEDECYDGCYGKGVIQVLAWNDPAGGDGISFGIQMFQRLRDDGEKLYSAGIDTDKWFETIADEGAAPESTKTGAGAGGLFGAT